MIQDRLDADPVTYSSVIAVCHQRSLWLQAFHLLRSMRQGRLQPELTTYTSTMTSCMKHLNWRLAMRTLRWLEASGLSLGLLAGMEAVHLQPDVVALRAGLQACLAGRLWAESLAIRHKIQDLSARQSGHACR